MTPFTSTSGRDAFERFAVRANDWAEPEVTEFAGGANARLVTPGGDFAPLARS